ncbi:hypothetical protein GDO78_006628 [Eleutherodactylus coqui]|uniref:Uncharacterized protein n=1 Tax=Eleutherodactylus coqui TaxID=57060 RepID=A0A8J6KA38_ELECQ|nr:hypothetical protein GDO78_006628 [Eleutherodactylus coqui]
MLGDKIREEYCTMSGRNGFKKNKKKKHKRGHNGHELGTLSAFGHTDYGQKSFWILAVLRRERGTVVF